jgi:hypothetical protein
MKKKLKIGFKDRSPKEVIIDKVTFMVKPMAQETMTGLALYSQGIKDTLLSLGMKKEFVKTHITGWSDLYDEDGDEVEYTQELAVEYLTDDDYDDLLMMLYWKSIESANIDAEEKEKNKDKAKK